MMGILRRPVPTTNPTGLAVSITYDGSSTVPTNVGTYPVVATISDPNYSGTTNGTLVIGKADAIVSLSNLSQTYNGTAKSIIVQTTPAGLNFQVTYNGSLNSPVTGGNYTVVIVVDNNYQGSASSTLQITAPAWDINADGIVNVQDLSLLGRMWNHSIAAGNLTYPAADVGSYGIVDVRDLSILGLHWNQTW